MNCDEARPLIDDDLDGRLETAERERLETHVASCGDCRAAREELAGLRRLFAAVPPVGAPAGLRDAVLHALPHRRGRLLRLAPWLGVLAAAAAVLIVAVSLPPSSVRFPGTAESQVASAPAAAADGAGSAHAVREEPADRATRLRAPSSGAGGDADLDDAPATSAADAEAIDREVAASKAAEGGSGTREARADAPATAAEPEPVSEPAAPPSVTRGSSSPRGAPPLPSGARPESVERDRSAVRRKLAERQRASRLLAERRIVVFSDRVEAERFVAALRGAVAPASEAAAGAAVAGRPGPAPGGGASAGEDDAGGKDADGDDGGAAKDDTALASRYAPDSADRKLPVGGYVATAAATELAEAAASGNASVLAEFSLPAEAPRVSDLLRGALEGRGWAAPLSERLYARARAVEYGGEDRPGRGAAAGPAGGGDADGSRSGTGAAGAPAGPLGAEDEGRRAAPDHALDSRPGAAAATFRIVVLVLE